jgi:hypothetical protein
MGCCCCCLGCVCSFPRRSVTLFIVLAVSNRSKPVSPGSVSVSVVNTALPSKFGSFINELGSPNIGVAPVGTNPNWLIVPPATGMVKPCAPPIAVKPGIVGTVNPGVAAPANGAAALGAVEATPCKPSTGNCAPSKRLNPVAPAPALKPAVPGTRSSTCGSRTCLSRTRSRRCFTTQ